MSIYRCLPKALQKDVPDASRLTKAVTSYLASQRQPYTFRETVSDDDDDDEDDYGGYYYDSRTCWECGEQGHISWQCGMGGYGGGVRSRARSVVRHGTRTAYSHFQVRCLATEMRILDRIKRDEEAVQKWRKALEKKEAKGDKKGVDAEQEHAAMAQSKMATVDDKRPTAKKRKTSNAELHAAAEQVRQEKRKQAQATAAEQRAARAAARAAR